MSKQSPKRATSIQFGDEIDSPLLKARMQQSNAPLFVEEILVQDIYDGWRIDRFLSTIIPRISRTRVQQFLEQNVELVPQRRVKASTPLREGDLVRIVRTEHIRPNTPTHNDVQVLARLGDIAVVAKPPGVLIHRNSKEVSRTMDAFLAKLFPEDPRVESVHRLDRETSGCLLAAFGDSAIPHWRVAFQNRNVKKTYLAIVEDPSHIWPEQREHLITTPLGIDPNSQTELMMGRGTLSAQTFVRCLQREGHKALLELHPLEGRQHQLRAHLRMQNTPIVGDKLYQAGEEYFMRWNDNPEVVDLQEPLETPFHCLHAWKLSLPINGETLLFVAPIPAHFFDAMPSLNLFASASR